MKSSATNLRERRLAETSSALRSEARRLTAEHGFSGFTVEELCSEVGVSRRTFFNYFASKENAVLGIPVRDDNSDLDEAFLAADGALIDDLADLHIARWQRRSLTKVEAEEMSKVFEREPRLLAHFLGLVVEGEREDIALVRRRPDAATDLLAETAVQLLAAIMRPAIVEYLSDDAVEFRAILLRRLAVVRELSS